MTWMQLSVLVLVISLTGMGICARLEQIAFQIKMLAAPQESDK
jgi:hypothetical protein